MMRAPDYSPGLDPRIPPAQLYAMWKELGTFSGVARTSGLDAETVAYHVRREAKARGTPIPVKTPRKLPPLRLFPNAPRTVNPA